MSNYQVLQYVELSGSTNCKYKKYESKTNLFGQFKTSHSFLMIYFQPTSIL